MTFGTEFWSAISGAIVGGVIALIIQLIALNAAKNERIANQKQIRKALGYSAMFKTLRIHSNLFNLHLHIEESFAAVDPRSHGEPWSFVLPLANSPDDVHFSPDEMSLILSLKDPDLTNMLMSLDVIHNSLIDIFDTYREMRTDTQSRMPAEMVGNVGESKFSKEEWQYVRPRMVSMNQLIQDTRERTKLDYDESQQAVDKLNAALNAELGLSLKLEFMAEKLAKLNDTKKKAAT